MGGGLITYLASAVFLTQAGVSHVMRALHFLLLTPSLFPSWRQIKSTHHSSGFSVLSSDIDIMISSLCCPYCRRGRMLALIVDLYDA